MRLIQKRKILADRIASEAIQKASEDDRSIDRIDLLDRLNQLIGTDTRLDSDEIKKAMSSLKNQNDENNK